MLPLNLTSSALFPTFGGFALVTTAGSQLHWSNLIGGRQSENGQKFCGVLCCQEFSLTRENITAKKTSLDFSSLLPFHLQHTISLHIAFPGIITKPFPYFRPQDLSTFPHNVSFAEASCTLQTTLWKERIFDPNSTTSLGTGGIGNGLLLRFLHERTACTHSSGKFI